MTPPPPPPPPAPPLPAANRAALGLILVAIVAVVGGVFLLTPDEDDETPSADDFLPPPTAPTTTGTATGAAPPSGGATPEATVEAYLDAVVDVDCEAMVSLLTDDRWPGGDRAAAVEECTTTAGTDPEMAAAMADLRLATPVEQDGTVTIEAHGELGGTPLLLTFTLVPADDTWRIERIG